MSTYLIRLKPLENYFLGGDRTFSFGEGKKQFQASYYIRSEKCPSQTTLLGALRFSILDFHHEVKHDFSKGAKELIGSESFSMSHDGPQDYGKILSISSLFLIDEQGERYVPTPFDHAPVIKTDIDGKQTNIKNKTYTPFTMRLIENDASEPPICLLPTLPHTFNIKDKITDSIMRLSDNSVFPEPGIEDDYVFTSHTQVGIYKKRPEEDSQDESYYKKEYVKLNPKYCFAFYAEIDDIDDFMQIVYIGQGKCAFQITAKHAVNDLDEAILKAIQANHPVQYPFCYAVSDIKFRQLPYCSCAYSVVKTRSFRNLKTNYGKNRYFHKLSITPTVYQLAQAGSIFYLKDKIKFIEYVNIVNCQQIGLNHIIIKEEKI